MNETNPIASEIEIEFGESRNRTRTVDGPLEYVRYRVGQLIGFELSSDAIDVINERESLFQAEFGSLAFIILFKFKFN